MVSELSHGGHVACVDLKIGKSREAMGVFDDANDLYIVIVLVVAEPLQ